MGPLLIRATLDLAHRLVLYLYRAGRDPELRFDAEGALLALDLLRRRKGWNRRQLATALRVAPSALSAYEEGHQRMVPIAAGKAGARRHKVTSTT